MSEDYFAGIVVGIWLGYCVGVWHVNRTRRRA